MRDGDPDIDSDIDELAPVDFEAYVEERGIDHIDFGCSSGASLEFAQHRLDGRRGLGIDIAPAKVRQARDAGFDAVIYDINEIPDKKLVRFVTMSHFLEHIPDPKNVTSFIRKACAISTDFVFIRQPYFDSDGYLFERGLKLYWSDWAAHPNRMTSLEMAIALRKVQQSSPPLTATMHARGRVVDSWDSEVHSLASPPNKHEFHQGLHADKGPLIVFDDNVFRELTCLITFDGVDHDRLLERLNQDQTLSELSHDRTIYDSRMADLGVPSHRGAWTLRKRARAAKRSLVSLVKQTVLFAERLVKRFS